MTVEERIQFLLHAAGRAEQEGAERVARSLRRMAEEARPLEVRPLPGSPRLECCPE